MMANQTHGELGQPAAATAEGRACPFPIEMCEDENPLWVLGSTSALDANGKKVGLSGYLYITQKSGFLAKYGLSHPPPEFLQGAGLVQSKVADGTAQVPLEQYPLSGKVQPDAVQPVRVRVVEESIAH